MKALTAFLLLIMLIGLVYIGCSPEPQQGGNNRDTNQQTEDRTPPTLSIISPTNNSTNTTTGNISILGTATDSGSGVKEVYVRVGSENFGKAVLDNTNWSTNVSLSDGSYIIQAYAIDNAGNTSTTQQVSIVIDTGLPTVTILSPANNSTNNTGNITVSGTATDTGSGIKGVYLRVGTNGIFRQVSISGSSWNTNLIGLMDDLNVIQVYAEDNVGRVSSTQQVTVLVDKTPPTVSITNPVSGSTLPSNFTVSGTANDALSGVKAVYLRVGVNSSFGKVNGTTNWNTNVNITVGGSYIVQVYAEDNAGNISITDEITVNVDPNMPTVIITSPGTDGSTILTNTTSLAVFGTASANVVTIVYRIGNDPWGSISGNTSWTINLGSLSQGSNKVEVFGTNSAGLSSLTQQIIIVVDTASPNISSVSPADNTLTNTTSVVVSGSVSDVGVAGVKAGYLRGGTSGAFGKVALSGSSWSTNVSGLSDGTNVIEVYAEDNAGNVSVINAINIIVDTIPPNVSITSPADNTLTNTTSVVVSGNVSDVGVAGVKAVYLRVGTSGAFGKVSLTGSSWNTNLSGLSGGTNVIQYYAEDNAGNVSVINAINIIVDTIPPNVSITSPADGSTITNNLPAGGLRIIGTASDSLSGVKQVYVSVDGG
ncbi:MAG: Ig-like domain-containing protein, partial [Brevinematia bacterium]